MIIWESPQGDVNGFPTCCSGWASLLIPSNLNHVNFPAFCSGRKGIRITEQLEQEVGLYLQQMTKLSQVCPPESGGRLTKDGGPRIASSPWPCQSSSSLLLSTLGQTPPQNKQRLSQKLSLLVIQPVAITHTVYQNVCKGVTTHRAGKVVRKKAAACCVPCLREPAGSYSDAHFVLPRALSCLGCEA